MHLSILLLSYRLALSYGLITAPYQVGIYLFDSYNPSFRSKNFAIGSAAIIHPLFCVTVADCVHTRITLQNEATPFSPSSIYIKSGNFSDIRENIKYVNAIHVHPDFNTTTLENDIALIQVESLFQFENIFSERWVQIPNVITRYEKCTYSINMPNSAEHIYPFGELKRTIIVNNRLCNRNETSNVVNNLCSFYEFDHLFMCQIPEKQLSFSRDRGTPLICNNELAGLLSIIIPANTINSPESCSKTLQAHAYYTNVALFERWIHSVIAVNSPAYMADGKPIPLIPITPPYQNELSIQPAESNTGPINCGNLRMACLAFAFILFH